jgi:hypothetical protein
MGRNIYFTDRELSMARDYVFEATDILGNASDTAEQVDEDMENGLGSALRNYIQRLYWRIKIRKV